MIQNISAEAGRELNLLQTLYSEYKANPAATTLAKIQNVISDLNQNLPMLLGSAHLSNPTLSARIAAAGVGQRGVVHDVDGVPGVVAGPERDVEPRLRRVGLHPQVRHGAA